jgi:hypothetical protein
MPWRRAIAFVAVIAACYLVATSSDKPPKLSIETVDLGPEKVAMRAPARMPAGVVEIELRNRGDTLHDAQLFRVDGDRDSADILAVLEAADSSPKPRWLHPAGGVAPTRPGETATVTQVLQPGVYYVADTQERDVGGAHLVNAAKDGIARLEVHGQTDDELPGAPASIVAREYGFDTVGVKAGANRVAFRNAGRQLHQVVAFPIDEDVPFGEGKLDVLAKRNDTGWVPVDVPHGRATTVLEGGREQVTEMTFDPGRYLLLCFVTDRAGGGPQWSIGMTGRLDVSDSPPSGIGP